MPPPIYLGLGQSVLLVVQQVGATPCHNGVEPSRLHEAVVMLKNTADNP